MKITITVEKEVAEIWDGLSCCPTKLVLTNGDWTYYHYRRDLDKWLHSMAELRHYTRKAL
jgi:hypothetical protein